jgi:hypothetical protein
VITPGEHRWRRKPPPAPKSNGGQKHANQFCFLQCLPLWQLFRN